MADLNELIAKEPSEAIPSLGSFIGQLSKWNYRKTPERDEVLEYAVRHLLAIPGHATYYENRIQEARKRMNEEEDPSLRSPLIGEYQSTKSAAFWILSSLPSPETVKVLGEFLFDDQERVHPSPPGASESDENLRQYETGMSSNSSLAKAAFALLPLSTKPVHRKTVHGAGFVDYPEDLQPWRLWYEQVRAGTRTFRFEGDPQAYSLAGPVTEARTPSEARVAQAPDLSLAADQGEQGKGTSRSALFAVAGALVLCAFAAWKALRVR